MTKKISKQHLNKCIVHSASKAIEMSDMVSILQATYDDQLPVNVSDHDTSGPKEAVKCKSEHFLNKSAAIETKRFKRLLDKLKDECQSFTRNLLIADCMDFGKVWMKRQSYNYIMELKIEDLLLVKVASLIFKNFKDHISNTQFSYYFDNFSNSNSRNLSYAISFFGELATIEEFTVEQNRHLWELLIEKPNESIDGLDITGYELCDYELKNAIKDHISSISLYDDNIKESNYMTTIDLNRIEIQEVLQYTVYRIVSHIYKLHAELGSGENLETLSALNKKIQEAEDLIEEKDVIIQRLSAKIASLETDVESKKSTINQLKNDNIAIRSAHSEEINKMQKEILRIQHAHKSDTVEKAKASINEQVKEDSIEKVVTPETMVQNIDIANAALKCDINLKYLFVVGNGINQNLLNRIEDEFPNAKLVDSTRNINPNDIDLVILLTEYIPHILAYSYKGQCTSRKIPYMYCSKTNIEHIKADIAAKMCQNQT